jgi:hypothetical protein
MFVQRSARDTLTEVRAVCPSSLRVWAARAPIIAHRQSTVNSVDVISCIRNDVHNICIIHDAHVTHIINRVYGQSKALVSYNDGFGMSCRHTDLIQAIQS